MIRYALTESGIRDRETGTNIPIAAGNRHYKDYLEWIAEGNTPIPVRPSRHHNLDENEQWVEDIAAREDAEARQFLADSDKEQARAVDDIIEYLTEGTPIPQVVLDRQEVRVMARLKLQP